MELVQLWSPAVAKKKKKKKKKPRKTKRDAQGETSQGEKGDIGIKKGHSHPRDWKQGRVI